MVGTVVSVWEGLFLGANVSFRDGKCFGFVVGGTALDNKRMVVYF